MDKRELILDAALHLFVEDGFQNTSTASISRRAGVGTGTLFNYFASKEELIDTLYRQSKEALAGMVQERWSGEASISDQLHSIWMGSAEWALANPMAFRFINMYSSSPFINRLTQKDAADNFDFVDQLVESGIRQGLVRPIDSGLIMAIFKGQWTETVWYLIRAGKKKKQRQVLDMAFDIFWQGIRTEG